MRLAIFRHEACASSVTKENGNAVARYLYIAMPTLGGGSGGADGRWWSGPARRRTRRFPGQRILPETEREPCSSNFSICQCVDVGCGFLTVCTLLQPPSTMSPTGPSPPDAVPAAPRAHALAGPANFLVCNGAMMDAQASAHNHKDFFDAFLCHHDDSQPPSSSASSVADIDLLEQSSQLVAMQQAMPNGVDMNMLEGLMALQDGRGQSAAMQGGGGQSQQVPQVLVEQQMRLNQLQQLYQLQTQIFQQQVRLPVLSAFPVQAAAWQPTRCRLCTAGGHSRESCLCSLTYPSTS